MNLDRAKSIKGFMNDPELEWLAEQASRHRRIVEIGSWTGRSTRALVDNTFGVVYSVDTWEGGSDGDLKDILNREGDHWAFAEFQRNMCGVKNLRVFAMTSAMAAESLKSFAPFDMVFIDGDHQYKAVRNDIMLWLPLVAEDGLLCGHDYTETRAHCAGVKKAVDELIGNVGFMSLTDNDRTIWWRA